MDIKYGWLHGEKKFFYILAFIDVFTRKIKGHYIGRSCNAMDLQRTLQLAIESNRIKENDRLVIRSDNGPQMRSKAFKEFIQNLGLDHEFIPVRTPNKNAHIESFFSTLDRHIEGQYLMNLSEAYRWLNDFINFYNGYRIHGSLGMTPIEFANKKELHEEAVFAQAI